MSIAIIIILFVIIYIIHKNKKVRKQIERQKQNELEDKKQKQEIVRDNFKKIFPEVDEKFSYLMNTVGKDENMSLYRTEASKIFNEILKLFLTIIEADKRLDSLNNLRKNLLNSIDNNNINKRVLEGNEKSKELIVQINKESNDLKKYIANAKEEIKASSIDFMNTAAEIELSKSSGKLIELSKLQTRCKNLSYLTEHMPLSSDLQNKD